MNQHRTYEEGFMGVKAVKFLEGTSCPAISCPTIELLKVMLPDYA